MDQHLDKATPRPVVLEIETHANGVVYLIDQNIESRDPVNGHPAVAAILRGPNALSRARDIVTAVNSYDQLRTQNAALREALGHIVDAGEFNERCTGCQVARAALEEVK